jgi:hypothetical protein
MGSNSGPRLFVIIAASASGSYSHPAMIDAVALIMATESVPRMHFQFQVDEITKCC